jgi:hypothetical protein
MSRVAPSDWPHESPAAPTPSSNVLEFVLAAGGLAAWFWCAWQVARVLFP